MKILLIEDDQDTRDFLVQQLTAARYAIEQAEDGQQGLELATKWAYDLIVLDIQLPKVSGLEVCKTLRSAGNATPILMLTAQTAEANIITGLDAGADDYVTKPCDIGQLLARIRALLRRSDQPSPSPMLSWGPLTLNPSAIRVTYNDTEVGLTPKEFALLELFLRHPQRVFSRNAIMDHLWAMEDFPTEGAVTNLVKDLRHRLKSAGLQEEVISTIYGLGYRLKEPTTPPTYKTAPPAPAPAADSDSDDSAPPVWSKIGLDQVTARFRSTIQDRIEQLETQLVHLRTTVYAQGNASEPQQAARQSAHRLAGGLGTFGYQAGSIQARQIEVLLQHPEPLNADSLDQLFQGLAALKQAVAEPPAVALASEPPPPIYQHLLVFNASPTLTNRWRPAATDQGWQLTSALTVSQGLSHLEQTPTDAILVMLESPIPPEQLDLLRDLKHRYPAIPVLVLAQQDRLEDRVQMVRLGVDQYLASPLPANAIFDSLASLAPQATPVEARVMVVDDDPLTRTALRNLLTPWGLQVTELGQTEQFWDVLRATQPDLLLLDLEMPTFNGIDLCQVVRRDPKFGNLTILVITAHTDNASVQQAFEAGADDLITKPIAGPELVSRVISRIERSRLRRQLDTIRQRQTQSGPPPLHNDSLTQIANRRRFDDVLQSHWQQHSQTQSPLSIILCDVDYFKAYNDIYGSHAGDLALTCIAQGLESTINPNTDLVARYGGEEFAILLPHTSLDGALQVVGRIQQVMSQLHIPHSGSQCGDFLTLSLGISGTIPQDRFTPRDLMNTADQALYNAKARGRHTYCLYPM